MNIDYIAYVFINAQGDFGNPVGIVIDSNRKLPQKERLSITSGSGFSEVVFINDLKTKNISIYSPLREISFAGHALVGVAKFLKNRLGQNIDSLTGIQGTIKTWEENDQVWVRGNLNTTPPWNFKELDSAEEIDNLTPVKAMRLDHSLVWAWQEQDKGLIRARTFAIDWGIPEDESNGSGALNLTAYLDRSITIIHGKGSIIHARPFDSNNADVGGLVKIQ